MEFKTKQAATHPAPGMQVWGMLTALLHAPSTTTACEGSSPPGREQHPHNLCHSNMNTKDIQKTSGVLKCHLFVTFLLLALIFAAAFGIWWQQDAVISILHEWHQWGQGKVYVAEANKASPLFPQNSKGLTWSSQKPCAVSLMSDGESHHLMNLFACLTWISCENAGCAFFWSCSL